MTDLGNAEVLDIKYRNNKVTYLKIESFDKIVEYDGYNYTIID